MHLYDNCHISVENACLNENKGGCEQTCTWGENGRECGCQAWYKLNDDNITCSESELYLIGANKTTIFNLSVDSNPGALKVGQIPFSCFNF